MIAVVVIDRCREAGRWLGDVDEEGAAQNVIDLRPRY
jgi:hypothetical protein